MALRSDYCFIVVWMISISISECVDVTIPNLGTVRGRTSTIDGYSVDIFQGIPFAKPPVGNLRFKPPVAVLQWSGVKNATNPNIFCPQSDFFTKEITGDEDCLYLNIYRPSGATTGLPVMVWIHGGGYQQGSASFFRGDVLATKQNVIVVTINYRLGVLGFFNLKNTDSKGNNGLLDQIMALKWVQSNIASFSGDKTKVTIFGESAGAGSVTLLMLSPRAKGLFSRVIAESGSPTCLWAVYDDRKERAAKDFAKKLGCKGSRNGLIACLRSKDWRVILEQQKLLNEFTPILAPNVDDDVICEFPRDQMKEGMLPISSVELLIGYNKDEGPMFLPNYPSWNKTIFETELQFYLDLEFSNAKIGHILPALTYNYQYHYQTSDYLKYAVGFSDFTADIQFVKCGVNFAEAWSKVSNTYLYEFAYLPEYRAVPAWNVSHALEVDFVFGIPFFPLEVLPQISFLLTNTTSNDRIVSANVMSMWANFAKTGNPGNNWPKYDAQQKQYLRIDLQNTVQSNPRAKAMAFWNEVIPWLIGRTSKRSP